MNPVDRARKEAKKKEIKKNKKQRLQVRSAAIEKREPEQIIAELEKLDPQNSFYRDRRKKLKETLSKILAYYKKEDPTRHDSLMKLELECENRHQKRIKELEAIKAAKEVKIEDILLPPSEDVVEEDKEMNSIDEIADDDALLSDSIYVVYNYQLPGCPPGLPPDLGQVVKSFNQNSNATSAKKMVGQANKPLPSNVYKQQQRRPKLEPTKISMKPKIEPKKIIAAKPVLYKPSVTRFVPTSVRLKSSTNSSGGSSEQK